MNMINTCMHIFIYASKHKRIDIVIFVSYNVEKEIKNSKVECSFCASL